MSTNVDDAIFVQELRKLPYDRRWNLLKPKLEGLFRSTEVEHICRILKERWAFAATPTQCKYRFKSWGWKKSIPETVKRDIRAKVLKRAAQGKDTIALYKGHPVLPGRLQRTNKVTANPRFSISAMLSLPTDKHDIIGGYLPFGNSLLLNWRMPHGSHPTDPALVWNQHSPASHVRTPSDVEIRTPDRMDRSPSPMAPYAPFGDSLIPVVKHQRSMMLLQGRLPELLTTMSQKEQMTLSTWLYQNWLSAFVAAQSWSKSQVQGAHDVLGQNPRNFLGAAPTAINFDENFAPQTDIFETETGTPSQECCWAIHVSYKTYEEEFETDLDTDGSDDDDDDQQIRLQSGQRFISLLDEQLRSNDFSGIPEDRLPLPVPEIARQNKQHPDEWVLESVALAIMGRNTSLLCDTLRIARIQNVEIASIYPFHMAATFLDGGQQCCRIFELLSDEVDGAAATKELFTNDYGHTILDSFLLTIMRSHSTVVMKDIDGTLHPSATIPGQEVDICGRWSADSPRFQNLVASGETVVPTSWKHKFCHTSVQAVIHSTNQVLLRFPTILDLPSGLFKLTCFNCGLHLQLGPLHALVMTAFHLVTAGIPGEDLFAIVAYYLCLVAQGVSPLTKCDISPSRLLRVGSVLACSHELLTPHKTAIALQDELRRDDLPDCLWTGWAVFIRIMQITEDSSIAGKIACKVFDESDEVTRSEMIKLDYNVWESTFTDHKTKFCDNNKAFDRDCDGYTCLHMYFGDFLPYFGDSPILGHVWAAIQAELANHRKLDEKDKWLSESFSMKALLESLQQNARPKIGYVTDHILKPYCRCGNFDEPRGPFYPLVRRLREDIFQKRHGYRLLESSLHRATFLVEAVE